MAKSDPTFDQDFRYFISIPWTRTILFDPSYAPIPTPSRTTNASTEDALIAQTLHTPSTIPHWLTLIPQKALQPSAPITHALFLLTLSYGINGFPSVAHGGIIGVVVDECMGILLSLNAERGVIGKDVVTAWAKMEFLEKVRTPGLVCVRVKLGKKEERKVQMEAGVEGEGGRQLARGEALWVVAREEKL